MDSRQIEKILKNNTLFKGVYPRDKIPRIFNNRPSGIIVNTDSSLEPGEHWVSIIIHNKNGEYFDSFGLPPLHKDLINYLDSACPEGWTYNSSTIQHTDSKSCGLFCICYINSRTSGLSFSQFISSFSVNKAKNEIILQKCLENGVCSRQ
ncbi:MAG: Ulp1 family isopeptidase [Limnohabitans sp.]|nr:Ulp1 family isopeptidase [Limnohabitans sp.]